MLHVRRGSSLFSAIVAAAVVALVGPAVAGAGSPRVVVRPRDALLDAPFRVQVVGLRANERVKLRLSEPAYPRGTLLVRRMLRADERGVAEVRAPTLLALVVPGRGTSSQAVPLSDSHITISVTAGGNTLATRVHRFVKASFVTVRQLRPARSGLYGEYLTPRSASKRAGILLVGGSEGGLANGYTASLLASHGYPVLRLAYFGVPGLPAQLENIPLEYFERALTWLERQPEVDPDRTVVLGSSRGGELALLLGATYPRLVDAVAGYVPSDRVWGAPADPLATAWTLRGKPDTTYVIPVEKIAGPIFLVGAMQDLLWPSGPAVLAIRERMRAHHRSDLTMLDYPSAGHGVGWIVPNVPTRPKVNTQYGTLAMGGSPSTDARARADSWPKLLRFLSSLR